MPAGRYLRNLILGWIAGDDMPAAPAATWLHFTTTAPTATVVGTAPTITGYAPQEISPADWAALVTGANTDRMPIGVDLEFGPFTGSAQTATHAMLMDGSNPASANLLEYAQLASPRAMVDGGTVVIAAGDLGTSA